jgi:hypothetical protein
MEETLGKDSAKLGYPLLVMGGALLGLDRAGDAIPPLERALATPESPSGLSKLDRARARFALAQALWSARRDRPRARALAEEAGEGMARSTADGKKLAAWLAEHR